MHADAFGLDDGQIPDSLRQPHDCVGRQRGIVRWEKTIAEILAGAGYVSSCLGKWHIGAEDGRWPTDHGFDEWYGPLRTYDECMWLEDPHYDPARDGYSYMHEGRKGEGVRPI